MASPQAVRAGSRRPEKAASRREAAAPPSGPGRLFLSWNRAAPFLILAAVFCVYSNTFRSPFLYDDIGAILENSSIRRLADLKQVFSPPRDTSVAGRPILNLTLALNYSLSGLNVWSYHLLNILIHAGAGLALFGVIRRTFRSPGLREQFGEAADGLGLIVALLWTVHPLQTESVTYVIQRAEALVGFFFLLVFYCLARGAEADTEKGSSQGARQKGWYAAGIGAAVLGMASKEVMATAPVLALLYDRTFYAGTFREALKRRSWFYMGLAGTWLVMVAVAWGARSRSAGFSYEGMSSYDYARSEFAVVLHYLRLSVWPHPMVFHYGWPVAEGVTGVLLPAAVILGLVAATFRALRFRPALGFCGAWFFLILSPTSTIFPISDLVYEHRMYLSLAAVLALLVAGSDGLLRRRWGSSGRRSGAAVAAVVIVLFGTLSYLRNRDYRSVISIWSDTVAKRPDNYRARYNLAFNLEREGQTAEAEREYREALRIHPGEREALNALAMLLARSGRPEEAVQELTRTLGESPDPAETHMSLGLIRGMQGKPEEALTHYREALRAKPDLASAHFNMANALLQVNRPEEAREHYGEALRIKPDLAPAHVNLANLLAGQGDRAGAAAHFGRALETQPDNYRARYGLATVLAGMGRTEEARAQLEQALRIRPDFEPARQALGEIAGRGSGLDR